MEKRTILYVDDEAINLQLFEINIGEEFNIITASSGKEGLEKIAKNKDIYAVISDMRMPNMNGLQFIKAARELAPIINYYVLTGLDITPEIIEALNCKMILKYFSKPFNIPEILHTLNEKM